ncbi:MAG: peptidyl-prolyl cis-trans isomerase [Sedimentisphaerales bacterium]|nr:peptidyl-prolyl cis-trans isomerase [Sedimentisphaerales bacterium]
MHRYVVVGLILLVIVGCGDSQKRMKDSEMERAAITQKIELAEDAGGLALIVGGDTLTSDEVIHSQAFLGGKITTPVDYFKPMAQAVSLELFKQQAKEPFEQVLIGNISNIVLYQYAKRQAGDRVEESLEQAAQNEYRRFVLSYGGNQAEADEALKARGLDRKRYLEGVKREILIQSYVTSKLPTDNRPITHRELLDGYDEMKDQQFARVARIRFRLIDIQPDKMEATDPNQRQQLAEERAAQLLARMKSGEDFSALAKEYSNGPMKGFGGLWRPMQPTSLRAPYDVLAAETEKMKQGEIAGPIIAEGHVFIMKLEEKQDAGYEPFETVQEQVREYIIEKRRIKAREPLYDRIKQQAKLGQTDEFMDFCLEKIYRTSRQQETQPSRDTEGQNVNK